MNLNQPAKIPRTGYSSQVTSACEIYGEAQQKVPPGFVTGGIVVASVLLMVLRKADPLWIVVGAALVTLVADAVHVRSL